MYQNKYNTPPHWKNLLPKIESRNKRSYVKTMLPGKPKGLSIPAWIIAKRLLGVKATNNDVKSYLKGAKINEKPLRDSRAPVMNGDTILLKEKAYVLVFCREGRVISYRLDEHRPHQKLIVAEDRFKNERRLIMLNGERRVYAGDEVLYPGTIWTPDGLKSPTEIRLLVRMTGKDKFGNHEVSRVVLNEPYKTTIVVKNAQKEQSIVLDWPTLAQRKYLLLL